MDVVYLVNHLRLHPEHTTFVSDQLWMDFYNQMATEQGIILGHPHLFVESINRTLKFMDLIIL